MPPPLGTFNLEKYVNRSDLVKYCIQLAGPTFG